MTYAFNTHRIHLTIATIAKFARVASIASIAAASGCSTSERPEIATSVAAELEAHGGADVIIHLRAQDDAIARLQSAVIASLGTDLEVTHRYHGVPALAGRIRGAALERLAGDSDVSLVRTNGGLSGQLLEAVPAVGVDRLRKIQMLTGKGVRVAVLDSGIDIDHPDFEGAVVAQRCFASGACAPWLTNESANGDDDNGHGTTGAGPIASRGVRSPAGFAPEAELISVKVTNAQNRGTEASIIAGFEWLSDNMEVLGVDVVYAGIGTDALFETTAACDRATSDVLSAMNELTAAGVIIVAPSGNQSSTTELPAPACNTGIVAVGSTYDADVGTQPASGKTYLEQLGEKYADCSDATTSAGQIACYSNTPQRVDMVAPGGPIVTTLLNGGSGTLWGTSQAAAAVAGVAAILKQCNPGLTSAEFKRIIAQTGEPRLDPRSGRMFPFIRAVEAARVACPDVVPEEPAPAADGGVAGSAAPSAGAGANASDAGAGALPEPSSSAGGSAPIPSTPGGTVRRQASSLSERYAGGALAEPLDPDRSRMRQRRDAAVARPGDAEEGSRGERISSCSLGLQGPRPRTDGTSPLAGWLLAALTLTGSLLRRSRLRRCASRAPRHTRRRSRMGTANAE